MVEATTKQTVAETEAETVINDYQSVDLDIDSLVSKFIRPIDRYRSRNAPNVLGPLKQPGLSSRDTFGESRTHAFYRMLGLPVIAPDGKLFNPGFNPLLDAVENTRRQSIVSAIPVAVKKRVQLREGESRGKIATFSSGNELATVVGLTMGLRSGQRNFAIADRESIQSLEDPPEQLLPIPQREIWLRKTYKRKDGQEIADTKTNKSVSHILAPFTTDPVICSNLDPNSGSQSVVIGAPFLEKENLEHESNKYLKRPGIEFILRLRLRQQNVAEQTGIAIDNIDLSQFTNEINSDQQREIAATLTDDIGASPDDVKEVLEGSGRIELYTLNNLVRMFKGLVHLYVESLETIEDARNQIIWIPLPNDGGPERGSKVSTLFVVPKMYLDTWEIERRISNLQIKAALANMQMDIGETADETPLSFGDFAISEFQNIARAFEEQLQEERNNRDNIEAKASNALRVIEFIGGEVSGLGLLDIIAIYMALWSLDVTVLLSLIDDGAAQRLNQITELKTADTEARANGEVDALNAYQRLAERIQTILSYADRLLQREQQALRDDGGDVPRDEGTF
jgi:hypothetical protein